MTINVSSSFAFELPRPTDVLLQFEAAETAGQAILATNTVLGEALHCTRVPAQDGVGARIWMHADGPCKVKHEATVEVRRKAADLPNRPALAPHALPGEAVQYLLDSRYCPADRFQSFVESEFEGTSGGARVDAIRDWIAGHFSYVPGASNPYTDAAESFIMRQGICRDYAHMLVTLARASTIPARYVACYAPGVSPQDFHAVTEVFLADSGVDGRGSWQLVDATGMADPARTVKIGVGRDAADVSFLTSFGANRFLSCSVEVREV
ncbi:MAG: transglutaminase family protein [Erythrobacter sp.]|nr:transglutaminase family protein [Erythrobacter sp.]